MKNNYYITTTLPYVNSSPHVGFATELLRADVLARFKKEQGFNVFLNTGTDEHGKKIFESAKNNKLTPKEFVDQTSLTFKNLINSLGIMDDVHFIRTTDSNHIKGAQLLWDIVNKNGYIYKKKYQTKYCVGCELEKTDSDLDNGKCPFHPNKEIEIIDEDNYFFAFSKFQKKLEEFYKNNSSFIEPDFRFNELKSFVHSGLNDFSVSRLKEKMPWGISVPDDEDHVMYVWFDALSNYITTLGWPNNTNYEKFWENGYRIQVCGQDNLRQQGAMWQAILMAANLPNTDKVYVNGFLVGEDGTKMSKSLNNVINPSDVIDKYGKDSTRYLLLRYTHPFNGSPISMNILDKNYNADLVNGLGNTVSRILAMSQKKTRKINIDVDFKYSDEFVNSIEEYRFDNAFDFVWDQINILNKRITEDEVFKILNDESLESKVIDLLNSYLKELYIIANYLKNLLPETSKEILVLIDKNIKPESPIFPRV